MLHRLTGYQGLDACDLTLTHNIQLARCKFYTVGTFHMAMVTILYWYAPVRSKRPVGSEVAFTQGRGIETNPANRSRIDSNSGGMESEPEIGPFRKRTIPFRYEHKRQVGSGPLSGVAGFLRVHASAFHLLSTSILEKLFFLAGVFFYF